MAHARNRFIVIAIVCSLPAAVRGEGNFRDPRLDRREIRQDRREQRQTDSIQFRLSAAKDLWVEANLKDDEDDIRTHEGIIRDVISIDIDVSRQTVARFQSEALRSAAEFYEGHEHPFTRIDDRLDKRDDVRDLRRARQLLAAKEGLAEAFTKTDAFSNKYRLLEDYLDILRREQGLVQTEVAEDGRELREDRVEGRRE
ncbi:MAG TPA: hypothetical protein VN285_09360 [Candidatus Deferrimicrobium sp.]|nr:hypothetical protein [Candidatus Deferrimicrobium sp.]